MKAATVQAAPVFLDRERSTAKACKLIREAGEENADIVGFPEGFIPAHPIWYHFHPATGEVPRELSTQLFKNAVEVPGPVTEQLAEAAEDAGAYVVVGVCEREPDTTGSMYNSQLFFSPEGDLIGNHQKLRPTHGERLVHTQGKPDSFGAIDTDFGKMSGLICGENSNPLAVFALTAEYTRIHVMSWPPTFSKGEPLHERVLMDAKAFAQQSKAYVLSTAAVVDERMIEMMQLDEEDEEYLRDPEATGGSVIVGPDKEVVAGPLKDEEEILYGELDLNTVIPQKLSHDFAGHYNRPDVFELRINRSAPQLYSEVEPDTGERQQVPAERADPESSNDESKEERGEHLPPSEEND